MKKQIRDYEFDPANKRIYILDRFLSKHRTVKIEDFLLITNVTTGDIIYQFNDSSLGGSWTFNHLDLVYDTTSMSSSDKLQIFIDVAPSFHIRGEDGSHRGDINTPLYVSLEELNGIFNQILKELKKINFHLESITDENIKDFDVD